LATVFLYGLLAQCHIQQAHRLWLLLAYPFQRLKMDLRKWVSQIAPIITHQLYSKALLVIFMGLVLVQSLRQLTQALFLDSLVSTIQPHNPLHSVGLDSPSHKGDKRWH